MEKPTELPIEWHQMKGSIVALRGDEIIAIVNKMTDMPCEAFSVQPLAGVYTTIEAAKAEVEKGVKRMKENKPLDFVAMLRNMVAAMDKPANEE